MRRYFPVLSIILLCFSSAGFGAGADAVNCGGGVHADEGSLPGVFYLSVYSSKCATFEIKDRAGGRRVQVVMPRSADGFRAHCRFDQGSGELRCNYPDARGPDVWTWKNLFEPGSVFLHSVSGNTADNLPFDPEHWAAKGFLPAPYCGGVVGATPGASNALHIEVRSEHCSWFEVADAAGDRVRVSMPRGPDGYRATCDLDPSKSSLYCVYPWASEAQALVLPRSFEAKSFFLRSPSGKTFDRLPLVQEPVLVQLGADLNSPSAVAPAK